MKQTRFRHLIALIFLMCCTLGYAQKFKFGGLTYKVINASKRYVEVSYVEDPETVKIPSTITRGGVKYTVTSIGDDAFRYCSSLTSITLPSGLTSIGHAAFLGCESLTSITIPSSVKSIGWDAFFECFSLTQIQVAPDNPVYDSRDNCNAIIETKSNTLIFGCASTIIPSSVTSIGESAYLWCSNLTQIQVAPDNPVYDSRDNCNAIIETSSNTLISGCETTIIPSSVTSIGNEAFSMCYSLTSINIPSSVTSIGEGAFVDCTSLTSINIPSSVKSIGREAFAGCSSLTSITIPSSVKSIGDGAFRGCSNLTQLQVAPENPVYDSRDNCNAIIETKSNTLIFGCASTIIPSSVKSIGEEAFYHCKSLTSINIPSSVKSIGEWAFAGCSNLTSITIPSSVTSIGN